MRQREPILFLILILILSSCHDKEDNNGILKLSNGKVERMENFDSRFVTPRNVDVWLPDDYSTDKKYAVLYMHDGQMLFDSSITWNGQEWGVDETMGLLLKEGEIRNTIVVGIWNTIVRHSEYFPQKPFESLPQSFQDSLLLGDRQPDSPTLFENEIFSDNYLKFIVSELKPFIDNKYSTLPGRQNTFIAGSSMGGLISMYALCEYPEIFYGAACLSTHWIGTFDTLNNPIPQAFAEYLDSHLPPAENHKIYFDYGTETLDAYYEPYQKNIDSILIRHGYNDRNWKTLKFEGENHSERAWNKRLNIPLIFLLEKTK